MEIKCCVTCKFHEYDPDTEKWFCGNEKSRVFLYFTDNEFSCYEWRGEDE